MKVNSVPYLSPTTYLGVRCPCCSGAFLNHWVLHKSALLSFIRPKLLAIYLPTCLLDIYPGNAMSSAALPAGVLRPPPNVVVFGPRANCTLDICPVQMSVYGYRPSLAANISFIALYALAALVHTWLGIRWKYWWFTGCILVGAVNAIIGYVGRVMLYYNPFNFAAFILQISELWFVLFLIGALFISSTSLSPLPLVSCQIVLTFSVCITTGPVYYCAAIYITLALS